MGESSARPATMLERVLVWDPLVRVSHWVIALGCIANVSLLKHADEPHEWAGYIVLIAVLIRVLWGFFTPGYANFSEFFPTPRSVVQYVRLSLRRGEPRYIGHNPAGATMMVTLLATVVVCGATGWLTTLDAFWGNSTLQGIHAFTANAIIALVPLHVAGAVFASLRHRENLVLSMVTGYKRASEARQDQG